MKDQSIFEVEDVFFIKGRGVIAVGQLTNGSLRKGMKADIHGKQAEVLGIESKNALIEPLIPGIPVGLLLGYITKNDVKKGDDLLFK